MRNLLGKLNEHEVDSDGVRLTFIDMKNTRNGFFSVIDRHIAIIEYSNPIPRLWFHICPRKLSSLVSLCVDRSSSLLSCEIL